MRWLLKNHDWFKRPVASYMHGFVDGRGIISNAEVHVNYTYTFSVDIKNCFDRTWITRFPEFKGMEKTHADYKIAEHCFYKPKGWKGPRFAAQGLPTSPKITNYALQEYTDKLVDLAPAFSVYADDLTWSYDKPNHHLYILRELKRVFTGSGYKFHKAHKMNAKRGYRRICGINVGNDRYKPDDPLIAITRRTRRNLRTAIHIENEHQILGLLEFTKLKRPIPTIIRDVLREYSVQNLKETDRCIACRGMLLAHLKTQKLCKRCYDEFIAEGDAYRVTEI